MRKYMGWFKNSLFPVGFDALSDDQAKDSFQRDAEFHNEEADRITENGRLVWEADSSNEPEY